MQNRAQLPLAEATYKPVKWETSMRIAYGGARQKKGGERLAAMTSIDVHSR
jgi:hypothetical protein